ncbi:ferric reductase-like transmembrane domain-containing protein [Alicyclobacillus herbarius]|uniref:ferric reductase-like transmembrane domain-containing protein n=1 Tax=Alicyclobacillus herbarius TaxID=122960 RepID=UPI002357BBA9|nr:ferric reductase-like transmembrane domain-containing protein [Alicyclobacillus herbarius]
MEVINEHQRFPFKFFLVVTLAILVGSCLGVRWLNPGISAQNLFYWHMARSAGFIAYGLLTFGVLLGLSASSSLWDQWKLRKLITQLHQYMAAMVFPFLLFHLWGLRLDTTVHFTLLSLLVPFMSPYRPLATGFGVLALYTWLALIVTSYYRERIGVKVWRGIHYVSLPMFVVVTLHGLLTGTDTVHPAAKAVYAFALFVFLLLLWRRITHERQKRQAGRKPVPAVPQS